MPRSHRPHLHHRSSNPYRHYRIGLIMVMALLTSTTSSESLALTGLIPGLTNNYAECVIRQLRPATGTREINAIVGRCRNEFPEPSRRNPLDPRTVQSCYHKHQDRVMHRSAATALFIACQDYFRNT